MTVLDSRADRAAEDYAANRERMEALVAELRERTAQVASDRPSETVERHAARGSSSPGSGWSGSSIPGRPSSS